MNWGAQRLVLDELDAQPHPRDRRAQVVAHRGQHARAVGEHRMDAVAQAVQGAGGGADLFRPLLAQGGGVAVDRELLRGRGEAGERRRDPARGPERQRADIEADQDDGRDEQDRDGAGRQHLGLARGDLGVQRRAVGQPDQEAARRAAGRRSLPQRHAEAGAEPSGEGVVLGTKRAFRRFGPALPVEPEAEARIGRVGGGDHVRALLRRGPGDDPDDGRHRLQYRRSGPFARRLQEQRDAEDQVEHGDDADHEQRDLAADASRQAEKSPHRRSTAGVNR